MTIDSSYNEEKRLLHKISSGDESAFHRLFDQYQEKIYSLAMYLTRSEVLSEEIVQEVFIKVWTNRDQLNQIDYFNAWLRTVVRNTVSNHLRSIIREKLALQEFRTDAAKNDSFTDNTVIDREYQRMLQHAIEQLPPQQKKVYLLSRQFGLKNDEIAGQIGISVNTVKEYIQLALRSIRTQLETHIEILIISAIARHLY